MFGNPQDIVAMIAAASLIFGSGGAIALRRGKGQPPTPEPETATPESPPTAATTGMPDSREPDSRTPV